MNGFTRNAKHGLTLGNGQVWLGAPPVVLQFIFVFFHFVVLQNASSGKAFIHIMTLGK